MDDTSYLHDMLLGDVWGTGVAYTLPTMLAPSLVVRHQMSTIVGTICIIHSDLTNVDTSAFDRRCYWQLIPLNLSKESSLKFLKPPPPPIVDGWKFTRPLKGLPSLDVSWVWIGGV